jgi:hypothetical protein
MANPISGLTVEISTSQQQNYYDLDTETIKTISSLKEVTNYEYEVKQNEDKRKILVLKKEYLSAFKENFKSAMRYDKSSQYVDNNLKRANNPNI